jgi:hypothetical protein
MHVPSIHPSIHPQVKRAYDAQTAEVGAARKRRKEDAATIAQLERALNEVGACAPCAETYDMGTAPNGFEFIPSSLPRLPQATEELELLQQRAAAKQAAPRPSKELAAATQALEEEVSRLRVGRPKGSG